jgi:hypothetical protein
LVQDTEISVDGAAAELSEILFSAAKSSLNRCKVYKKDSPKNKKWFDKDLKFRPNKIWRYGLYKCVIGFLLGYKFS